MLRLLCLYLIVNIQYSFYEASPLIGRDVRIADIDEFPFIVSLSYKYCGDIEKKELTHFCGGTLINTEHVLTAAHCLSKAKFDQVVVKVGSIDLRNQEIREIDVQWWLTYSQYANITLEGHNVDVIYDVAIIKLKEAVSPDILLPTISYTPDVDLHGRSAVAAGWGRTIENKKTRYMKIGKFIVVPPEKCPHFIGELDPFLKELKPKVFLCTAAAPAATTTCGDSGGPLLRGDNNVIGVTVGFCRSGIGAPLHSYRNFFSSVNAYKGFIEAVKIR